MAGLNFTHYPYPYPLTPPPLHSFQTPTDLSGRAFTVLDARGMPLPIYTDRTTDILDSPYELNLSRKAVRSASSPSFTPTSIAAAIAGTTPNPLDTPFSPAELERILRMYDLGLRRSARSAAVVG